MLSVDINVTGSVTGGVSCHCSNCDLHKLDFLIWHPTTLSALGVDITVRHGLAHTHMHTGSWKCCRAVRCLGTRWEPLFSWQEQKKSQTLGSGNHLLLSEQKQASLTSCLEQSSHQDLAEIHTEKLPAPVTAILSSWSNNPAATTSRLF